MAIINKDLEDNRMIPPLINLGRKTNLFSS